MTALHLAPEPKEEPGPRSTGVSERPAPAAVAAKTAAGLALGALVAALGGLLGILGAAVEEFRSGGGILLIVAGAPVIEEALKPVGVYLLLTRWPGLLHGRLHTAALSALAGLTFGVVESLMYVNLYVDDPTPSYVTYRFTVTLGLHAGASFIAGLGINRSLLDWAGGSAPFPRASRYFFVAAMALHAVYNTVATILSLAGVLDFGD